MIWIRSKTIVYKQRISVFLRLSLKWQCNQIPETAFGNDILRWEQSVIG